MNISNTKNLRQINRDKVMDIFMAVSYTHLDVYKRQVYDFISGLQIGIANMADSLAAIKKLVYEEKKITPEPVSYTHLCTLYS